MPEFLDIVGQDRALASLQRLLGSQRMPHAFLFAGPAGVGRRTTAIALGRTLLCDSPSVEANRGRIEGLDDDFPVRQACGGCSACRMISAETHPDFQLVYKELARYHEDPSVRGRVMQEVGIDVIRSFLIAPAGRASAQRRGKVFVVLEAELMSIAAQNALLKTLEEPPDGVTIILICTRTERLLPTTQSRCATVRFSLLPEQFVTERLTEAQVPRTEGLFWGRFTGGSLGRALRLADQGIYQVKRDVIERISRPPGAESADLGEHLAKVTDKLAVAAVAAARKADGTELSKMLASRRAAGVMLELIAGAFSDALILATGADRPIVNEDQRDAVGMLADRFEPTDLAAVIAQLSEYEWLLWRNVNPKIVWDNVVITCSSAAALKL